MDQRILIVTQNDGVKSELFRDLITEGFDVKIFSNHEELDSLSNQLSSVSILLLDREFSEIKPKKFLSTVMEISPDVDVIMFSRTGKVKTVVDAFRHGVFDFLVYPFKKKEIESVIKRWKSQRIERNKRKLILMELNTLIQGLMELEGLDISNLNKKTLYTLPGGINLDLSKRLLWQDNHIEKLTPIEGRLMRTLIENKGRVISHKDLVLRIQGYETTDWDAPTVLRPIISRFRNKLRKFEGGDALIVNVRGSGYFLDF